MKYKFLTTAVCSVLILTGGSVSPASSPKESTTLKEALKGKFYIGAALNTRQISGRDTADVAIIKRQFDAIVAENCMKSIYLQPREGEFFFDDADRFVEFGEQNGMWITGHCLIWHSQVVDEIIKLAK